MAADIPIIKRSISTSEAIELFRDSGMYDKQQLFRYRRASQVNVYSLEDYEDYYYGYMAPSTGYVKYYDLVLYDEGFILQMPDKERSVHIDQIPSVSEAFYDPSSNPPDGARFLT